MAIYQGWREGDTWRVSGNGRPLALTGEAARIGGMSWGYGGAGTRALAFALLAAEVGEALAAATCHRFRDEVVAHWPQGEPWRLRGTDVQAWLRAEVSSWRVLATLEPGPVALLTARIATWLDGSGRDGATESRLAVLSSSTLALDGEPVAWQREGDLARLSTADTGEVWWCDLAPLDDLRAFTPPFVDGWELRRLRFPGLGREHAVPAAYDGQCLVRLRRWHGPSAPVGFAVISDLDGPLADQIGLRNEATSVTNRIELLATVLRADLDVPTQHLAVVTHTIEPTTGQDRFDLATFAWNEHGQASQAQWTHLGGMAEAQRLTGCPLDTEGMVAAWHAWPSKRGRP